MAAYIIGGSNITDPAGMAEYRKAVGPLVEKYGGKFLAGGSRLETLEGD